MTVYTNGTTLIIPIYSDFNSPPKYNLEVLISYYYTEFVSTSNYSLFQRNALHLFIRGKTHVCPNVQVETRVYFFFLSYGFLVTNQAWWQAPSPAEPPQWPPNSSFPFVITNETHTVLYFFFSPQSVIISHCNFLFH